MAILSLLTDPGFTDNRLYVVRPIEAGPYTLLGPYGEKPTPARWAIFTDGIGVHNQFRTSINDLDDRRDGDWRIRNTIVSGQVIIDRWNSTNVAWLTQDTRDNAHYQCDEVDLWILAVTHVPGLITEPGVIPMEQQPPLSEMKRLTYSWWEGIRVRRVAARCAYLMDAALTMGSVYFHNIVSGQTFQYQIVTSDNRFLLPVGSYYANLLDGAFLGVSDNSATVYGVPYLIPGVMRDVSIDILPRVFSLLAAAPNDYLDKDLRNWRVQMVANGSYVNGSVRIECAVAGMRLEAEV